MALQHLRSSTAHKRPIPTVMSAGQIAINTNEASPGLFFKDSNGDLVKVGPVHIGTTAPNSSPASVAATALVTGTVYQILTVGTSDFTLVGASANTVGTIFTATGTTTGTGTVSGQQGVEKGEQWLDTTGGTYVLKIYDGTDWRSESGTFVDVSGDTMTGDLVMNNANIVFEGATADDFETTLTVTDPTADRSIVLPDVSGDIVTTGDTGTVTSTMIADGTIVNADVNASAAIAGTKIDPDFGSQTIETTGVFSAADGAAATPSITFTGDTNTGIYRPGADQVAISTGGTAALTVNSSQQVGVGTSSPDKLLHLAGADTAIIRLENTDTTITTNQLIGGLEFETQDPTTPGVGVTGGIRMYAADTFGGQSYMTFSTTNGSSKDNEVVRINNVGYVGIGTTTVSDKLHVGAGNICFSYADGSTGLRNKISWRTESPYFDEAAYIAVNRTGVSGAPADLVFATGGAGTASERMRIDSSGRLLVGTSNGRNVAEASQANLQVEGTSFNAISIVNNTNDVGSGSLRLGKSRGTTNSSNTIVQSGDYLGSITFAGADGTDLETAAASIAALVDGTPGANDMPGRLVFSTTADGASSPTERMRITSAGKIAMGNTVTAQPETLQVYALDSVNGYCILANVSGTGGRTHIRFENGNGIVGAINTSGTTTTYATSSDYRLKDNVVPLTDSITRLQQLKPKRFNFIADADTTVDGFLAHEAQTVVPEAVTGTHNEVDDDGNAVMQGIDQSKLVPLLTAALQEAIGEIESLKARVAALEAS